ncbi:MAG: hypothetical protein HQK61_11245, partial [Desulfamplus sp.]|nr:hypothetical protein [Desulfamplus sp.]
MSLDMFEKNWNRADVNQQIEWISKTVDTPVAERIKTVLAGLSSFHFSVRSKAKEALEDLQENITTGLNSKDKKRALLDSALLSVNVYQNINETLSAPDIKLFLEILLESGGRSPFYAWKLCQSKMFTTQTVSNIVSALPEACRLVLVNQYLASPPSVRREYAEQFVKILRDISDQKAVLKFYAYLFDMQATADIFLKNIKESLRDPQNIIAKYVNNEERSNKEREEALKSVAMISPVINPSLLLRIITTERATELRKTAFQIIERSPFRTYVRLTDTIMDIVCGYKLQKITDSEHFEATRTQLTGTIDPAISSTIKPELEEAMEHFRAAVISSHKKQFYLNMLEQHCTLEGLINRVRKEIPELMPLVLDEIASFSRISFCFIQEMAEDPSGTMFQNSDIEHALICGMIRKRPERFLKILEAYINHPVPAIKSSITRLIEKINNSLAEEKDELKR